MPGHDNVLVDFAKETRGCRETFVRVVICVIHWRIASVYVADRARDVHE
jgi:hypothetical protein